MIVLWLAGGPSQLETFDPHPGKRIAGETRAIHTAVDGIQLADGLGAPGRADGIDRARPLAGEQGGGPRARHVPGEDRLSARSDVVHPSIGAICCHELPVAGTEIPRHISILPQPMAGPRRLPGRRSTTRSRPSIRPRKSPTSRPAWPIRGMQQRLADLDVVEARLRARPPRGGRRDAARRARPRRAAR